MFENQQRKIKRSARLIKVLSKYGFQDVLSRLNVKTDTGVDAEGNSVQLSFYERVRKSLEDLGPTFVKLGQSFSDRDDLLPADFITQLQLLQDNVLTVDLDVRSLLIEEFGAEVDNFFENIPHQPIAAASIAQVYKATMKNGEPVIIKVKRPDIDKVIADDLLILKDLVSIIDTYTDYAEQLNLKYALLAFEQSLMEELSLLNEKENILQFKKNFPKVKKTYVPNVYEAFCSDRVLTMEYVDGMKVTDIAALQASDIDPKIIAERGFNLFLSQVIDYGFFHADPHAGNLLVTSKKQLVFIDFGSVGKISDLDKPLFEQLIMGFMTKKASKVVRMLKKLSVYYKIPDEQQLEKEVYEILHYVHNASLKDISVPKVMDMMKEVLKNNRLVMPNYFYLLFKGVTLLDGVGRKLNPDMDVVQSLKPFVRKLIKRKLSPEALTQQGIERAADWLDDLEEVPSALRSLVSKFDESRFTVTTQSNQFDKLERLIKKSVINLIIALILCAHVLASALFWLKGSTELGITALCISVLLGGLLLLRVLRR